MSKQQIVVGRATPAARSATPAARSAASPATRSVIQPPKPAARSAASPPKPVTARPAPQKPVVHSVPKYQSPVQKRVQKLPPTNPHPKPSGYGTNNRHWPPYQATKDYCSWGHRNSGKLSTCEFTPGAYVCRYKHRCATG